MSDIVQNALRYNSANTDRSDPPNPHNGQEVGKQDDGQSIIGFDCSGFVCHVMIESGYRIDYESTGGLSNSKAFSDVATNEARPGDIILFSGHVGIVIEYDSNTGVGKFIHMRGSNNDGVITQSYFINTKPKSKQLDPNGKPFYYGISRKINKFRRINTDRYSTEVDLHLNNSNPNPTLRPLGKYVYTNYKVKTPKTIQSKANNSSSVKRNSDHSRKSTNASQTIANKIKTAPKHKKIKTKSIPSFEGYVHLIKRFWNNL
jgi:cell wall-associated NlpC family hydrolase